MSRFFLQCILFSYKEEILIRNKCFEKGIYKKKKKITLYNFIISMVTLSAWGRELKPNWRESWLFDRSFFIPFGNLAVIVPQITSWPGSKLGLIHL